MFDLNKASRAQTRLKSQVTLCQEPRKIIFLAGVDCGYDLKHKVIGAAVVVLKFPELTLEEKATYLMDLKIPYISGFLSFREAPVILKTIRLLEKLPDVTMIDGNGIAHPRRMGLASHIGVILKTSTIGCAKNPIYPYSMPGPMRGEYTLYNDQNGCKVGYCLRTQDRIKPVFVSPGNKIGFEKARDLVLKCSKFRVPEPLRQAHIETKEIFSSFFFPF